jgi:hypothetical protein
VYLYEHFAAGRDHIAERELDAFRRSSGDEHAIGCDRKAVFRVLGSHRLAGGRNARGRPVVVVAVPHRSLDGGDKVLRGFEPKGDGSPMLR